MSLLSEKIRIDCKSRMLSLCSGQHRERQPSESRRFALRFIRSYSVFRNAFLGNCRALTTTGNRVRHIVSSQDDAVVGLLERR